jgi:hypothetical protein
MFMHGFGVYLLAFFLDKLLASIVDSPLTVASTIGCLFVLVLNCLIVGNASKWSYDFWNKD